MQIDALLERTVEPDERRLLRDRLGAAARAGPPMRRALDHMPLGAGQRLARQHAMDARENRVGARGELHLQQLLARRGAQPARDEPGVEERARLRGEGEAAVDLRPYRAA